MTSIAEGDAKPRLRGRLLWVALALSLTLNVFFISGLVWSRLAGERPMTPAERFQETESELNLSANQREAFKEFIREVRQRSRTLREHNLPLIQNVWEELAKAQPDQAAISRSVDEATDNRRTYQREMTAALSTFLGSLSPAQREQFVELAKRPQDQRAHHIRRMILP
jgi:uncharacterized membrane protein